MIDINNNIKAEPSPAYHASIIFAEEKGLDLRTEQVVDHCLTVDK